MSGAPGQGVIEAFDAGAGPDVARREVGDDDVAVAGDPGDQGLFEGAFGFGFYQPVPVTEFADAGQRGWDGVANSGGL